MAQNPYHYGSPVSGASFAGRTEELDAVVDRMRDGVNVVVTAPRRYGKTSLLAAAAERVRDGGGSVVSTNLLRTTSFDALASRLATATYHLPGGEWRRRAQSVPEFLKRLRVRPVATLDETGSVVFSFSSSLERTDAGDVLEDVYTMLDDIARKRPSVLVLDEFQAVADLDPHLPELLKALADGYPRVSLVLAGSKRHLMENLVLAHGAPLYNMAERLALGPIDERVMAKFLRGRARSGGKSMTADAAASICALAGPVPYDIQRLAYEAFADAVGEIDAAVVDAALDKVVDREAETYAERFARLALGQRRVLEAIAAQGGVEHWQTAAFAQATGYRNPAGAAKAIRALEADEILAERLAEILAERLAERLGGAGAGAGGGRTARMEIVDPFFRAWLREGR